ncbi:hypothetical protein QOT17_000452 [Balamuthia mandrillaris]
MQKKQSEVRKLSLLSSSSFMTSCSRASISVSPCSIARVHAVLFGSVVVSHAVLKEQMRNGQAPSERMELGEETPKQNFWAGKVPPAHVLLPQLFTQFVLGSLEEQQKA